MSVHNSNKTHCPQGHEYNSTNTKTYNNHRICLVCNRERSKKANELNKQSQQGNCVRGHPLSGDNLFICAGRRRCRICWKMHDKLTKERKRNGR